MHECIVSLDDTGAMGLHYINGDLVGDIELDPATPEVLVYEPAADGDGVTLPLLRSRSTACEKRYRGIMVDKH